jgi:hypothetical protein
MAKAVNGQAVKGKENLNKSVPKSVKPAKTDAEEHHNEHHDDVIDFQDEREKKKEESIFDDTVKLYLQQLTKVDLVSPRPRMCFRKKNS